VLLMSSTSSGLVDSLERAAKLAQAYGAYVWAYAILAAALIVLLRRRDVAAAATRTPPRQDAACAPNGAVAGAGSPPHRAANPFPPPHAVRVYRSPCNRLGPGFPDRKVG